MNSSSNILQKRHDIAAGELQRYKLLVDSVQDYAIFLLDDKGYIVSWNKGAEKNKGYKADEIIGKHFSIFYSDEDNAARKPEKELEIAKKFGRAEDEDWRIRKDGSKFWASVVITALYDDGKLIGFGKVTRDLTERKQQEDVLRTANKQLKQQQLELQRLNQSKDDFISLASHQLRTPATGIKQLLGLFVDGIYTNLDENYFAIIKQAYVTNDRQINIVNSLLKVAQLDAGKVKLKKEENNLDSLLQGILDDFSETVRERDQTILYENRAENAVCEFDEQNLRMALENLISNALKYTHRKGVIKVTLQDSESELTISIEDNGVGIAEKDLKVLFEKFNRLPNELSEEVGGTGLGLYWAKKIIELHKGHIDVKSKLHEGTVFTVVIPRN